MSCYIIYKLTFVYFLVSDEYKYTNIYQALTPKQIAYNRTKHLREWLYNTDLKNKNN